MTARYLDGSLPSPATTPADADLELRAAAERAVAAYHAAMGRFHLDEALAAVIELTRSANGYAESQAPWQLQREGQGERLGQVLLSMAEACRILGHLIAPFTPTAAAELHRQLGAPAPYDLRGSDGPGFESLLRWGAGPSPWATGQPQPIFPRTELPDATAGADH